MIDKRSNNNYYYRFTILSQDYILKNNYYTNYKSDIRVVFNTT